MSLLKLNKLRDRVSIWPNTAVILTGISAESPNVHLGSVKLIYLFDDKIVHHQFQVIKEDLSTLINLWYIWDISNELELWVDKSKYISTDSTCSLSNLSETYLVNMFEYRNVTTEINYPGSWKILENNRSICQE